MKRILPLALAVLLCLCTGDTALAHGPKVNMPASHSIGKIPVGLSVYSTVKITNHTLDPLILSNESLGGDYFGFTALLPDTGEYYGLALKPAETRTVTMASFAGEAGQITMNAALLVHPYAEFNPDMPFPDSTIETLDFSVQAEAFGEPVSIEDTMPLFQLFADQTTGFGLFQDYFWGTPSQVRYVNSTNEPVTVMRASLWSGLGFRIDNMSHSLPAVILPGDTFKVFVSVPEGADTLDYGSFGWYDELLLETGSSAMMLASVNIAAGRRNNATGVEEYETQQDVPLELYPNPSASAVTIRAELREASLTITDLMGNTVARLNGSNAWLWDGHSPDGRKCSPGIYLALLRGKDISGKMVQKAERIIRQGD